MGLLFMLCVKHLSCYLYDIIFFKYTEFHILVDNTAGFVTAGNSINLVNMTFMLWVKRYANMSVNATIKFTTSEGNDVMIIYFTDVIIVEVP